MNYLNDKKILILGLGREGVDTLKFLKENIKYSLLGIADQSSLQELDSKIFSFIDGKTKMHLGENYLSDIANYDVIIKSPGVPFHLIPNNKNQKITSQSEIFLSKFKDKVIGVTGTKGKSTTCMLIKNTFDKAGIKSEVVGNIGSPALSYFFRDDVDYFIYELSSFQLQTITKSPKIVIFLNVFKDHLDKHKDFDEYVNAKGKITLFQKSDDFLIYNSDNQIVEKFAKQSKAKKYPFLYQKLEDSIVILLNILDIEKRFLEEAIKDFQGLPHRKEYVGKFEEIYFYNDSASTIPEATIKAIDEIKDIETIIIGGSDKGADISELIRKIEQSKIENIILFEGSGKQIEVMLENSNKKIFKFSNMKEVVDCCFENTKPGKSCVLSPGFASFNMFKSYIERGDLFKKFILNYEKKKS